MKFCTGWYPHPDAQGMHLGGESTVAPAFQDQVKQLVDLRDAGVAAPDLSAAQKDQILSRR